MMIVGDPEAGKTWLSLQLAYDIASGKNWLGYFPTQQARVLHLALEDWEKLAAPRWSKLKKLYIGARDYIYVASQPGLKLDTSKGKAELVRIITEYHIEVIIIDTWRAAISGDENASATSDNFYFCIAEALNEVENPPPLATVVNHHKSKPFLYYDKGVGRMVEYDKQMHAQRGSLDLEAKQDTIVELVRGSDEEDFKATLKFTKTKQCRVRLGRLNLKFNSSEGRFYVAGGTTAMSILELLKISKKTTIAELMGKLNKSRPTIDSAIDFLTSAGLVKVSGSTRDKEISLSDNL